MKRLFLLSSLFIFYFKIGFTQPGSVDLSFGKNGTVITGIGAARNQQSAARRVLLQPDGSIYVIFQTSDLTIITKKHADGSPDSTYGQQGFSASVTLNVADATMQKDGKIVVAGTLRAADISNYNFALARFNPNGSLDTAFNGDGMLTTDFGNNNDAVNSIAIQSDGKIVAVGVTTANWLNDDGLNAAIARYNPDGSLDTTFNNNGRLSTQLETNSTFSSAIAANGKIVVGGSVGNGLNLGRYNSNGTVDSTFKFNSGLANSNPNYFFSKTLAIQKDGKIVVGGYRENSNGNNNDDFNYDFVLARFDTSGSIDNTFGTNGIQTTDFRTHNDAVSTITIQNDGKIVAAGYASNGSNNAFAVARYNTNGRLDNTFDGDGKKMNFIGSYDVVAVSLAIQNNGKLVAAGYNSGYIQSDYFTNIAIARYNTNGSLDSTFHKTGAFIDRYALKNTAFTSSAAQKDGKIVAAGYAWNGKNFDFAVARYNPDGSLDNTFSSDGVLTTDIDTSDNKAKAVAIQADGKIVVAGYASNGTNKDFAVVRYNTDGSLDKTFSSDGIQTTDFGFDEDAEAIAIQGNGKIVVTGTLYEQYQSDDDKIGLVRYNTDGSLDNTFAEDGKQKLGSVLGAWPGGIAIQSDGKIVVAGTAGYAVIVARYKTNGFLDSSFGYNGITEFALNVDEEGSFTYGYSVHIQKDGKMIVGAENGFFDKTGQHSDILIARYNSDGSQDAYIEILGSTYNASVALQDDDKIVVVSNRYDIVDYGNDDYQEIPLGYVLARLNNDCTIDTTFGLNGAQYIPNSEKIAVQSATIANNKLYAVGYGSRDDQVFYYSSADENVNASGFLSSYFLTGNKAPAVSITNPANNAVYNAPATITVNATASNSDGTIASVKFYNGSTYLKTVFTSPYTYTLSNLAAGTYIITAKATDNSGAQTVSSPVKVIVNKAPVASITSPTNKTTFTAPATITVNATVSDSDGSINSVKFYNGSTYLKADFTSPYSYTISNLTTGTYSLTVKATDNFSAETISAPVKVKVVNAVVAASKHYSENEKTALNDALSLRLSPNPTTDIVNIQTIGSQQSQPAIISIMSVSGIVLKTINIKGLMQTIPLDVSSLVSGVYMIKIISGETVLYKQFVKL